METDFERARLEKRINRMEECRLDSSDSGQRQVAGSCEHGTEPYKSGGNLAGWGPIYFSRPLLQGIRISSIDIFTISKAQHRKTLMESDNYPATTHSR